MTIIAYGGGKPINISFLNSKNVGKFYLLKSVPPNLEARSIKLPKTDFFSQSIYLDKDLRNSFTKLHKLMVCGVNNLNIRAAIGNVIKFIIDKILYIAFRVRQSGDAGWSNTDYYAALSLEQRIWLDDINQTIRTEQNQWRMKISQNIARWIISNYEKLNNGSFKLGTSEFNRIREMVEEAVDKDKEFF